MQSCCQKHLNHLLWFRFTVPHSLCSVLPRKDEDSLRSQCYGWRTCWLWTKFWIKEPVGDRSFSCSWGSALPAFRWHLDKLSPCGVTGSELLSACLSSSLYLKFVVLSGLQRNRDKAKQMGNDICRKTPSSSHTKLYVYLHRKGSVVFNGYDERPLRSWWKYL